LPSRVPTDAIVLGTSDRRDPPLALRVDSWER
jgi:hypothetical protein